MAFRAALRDNGNTEGLARMMVAGNEQIIARTIDRQQRLIPLAQTQLISTTPRRAVATCRQRELKRAKTDDCAKANTGIIDGSSPCR